MTGSESGAIELNPEQAAVAEAPADSRLLVIAGAGQGKTEVVASRVEHLATEEGLSPSTEMLVLSFSRAAVHAVRSRIANREMAETNVRTFDSFASYLLVENDIEPVGDFESRIRQATKLLSDGDDDIYGVEDIQHVILDEVQDLVGDRAEMVLAILENLHEDAGFTALGDPLQAVYDFTLANSRSKTTSTQFITALTDRFNAERVSLGPNYRARGAFPKRVVSLGNVLREDHVVAGAQQRIKTFEDTLPHSGVVDDWGFLREPAGKTAILCKSNAEVLRVSRVLTKHDVRHVVRRQATDFGAARWIAGVLAPLAGPDVSRTDIEFAADQLTSSALESDEVWYLLKGAEANKRSLHQLNLNRVREKIRAGTIPLTLTQPDSADVIVSTIHRAKGLEFERIFFVHPNFTHEDGDAWAEIRERYVALSRARDDVGVIDIPNEWSWFENRQGRQRERKKSKQKKSYTASFEFQSRDVATESPMFGDISRSAAIQDALVALDPGTDLSARFETMMNDDVPVFTLVTPKGFEVGQTSEVFGRTIDYEFGYRYKDGWEGVAVRGLKLVSVETAAGDPRFTEEAGLGSSGFWLVPRVGGLAVPYEA